MSSVAELMSRELTWLEPESSVAEAAGVMASRRVGSILVMEGGRLAGIFTERDIVRALSNDIQAPRDPVGHWMTRSPRTIAPEASHEDAIRMMTEGNFRHLPVADASGAVVGMLSMRDLVRLGVAADTKTR
jgi:CBS domain-containing protein